MTASPTSDTSPNLEEIIQIGEGLLSATLPKARWTHAAHCLATLYLIKMRGDLDLAAEMPKIIRRYNEAVGTANSDTGGYHETLTQFYIKAIDGYLAHQAKGLALEAASARVLASPIGQRDFPLTYYSHDRLFSLEARHGWVEPDLQALDVSAL